MSNLKTITLTGGETKIEFEQSHMNFWVKNLGNTDIFVSISPDIIPESDGVMTVSAGNAACISKPNRREIKSLYLSGTEKVQIMGTSSFCCPFKTPAGGAEQSDDILSHAIWRCSYSQGYHTTNKVWDTLIAQSQFSAAGITLVYKINMASYNDWMGLFGYHNGENGFRMQHNDNTKINSEVRLPFHTFGFPDSALKIGETMVLILSDDSTVSFGMVNGEKVDFGGDWRELITPAYGNLIMMSSYNASDRYFNGTLYDMAVFDRALTESEAAAVTKKLLS